MSDTRPLLVRTVTAAAVADARAAQGARVATPDSRDITKAARTAVHSILTRKALAVAAAEDEKVRAAIPSKHASLLESSDDVDVDVGRDLVKRIAAWLVTGRGKDELHKSKTARTGLMAAAQLVAPCVDESLVATVAMQLTSVRVQKKLRVDAALRGLLYARLADSLATARAAALFVLGTRGSFHATLPKKTTVRTVRQEWHFEVRLYDRHDGDEATAVATAALDAACAALTPTVTVVPLLPHHPSAKHLVGCGGRFVRGLEASLTRCKLAAGDEGKALHSLVQLETSRIVVTTLVLAPPSASEAPLSHAQHVQLEVEVAHVVHAWLRGRKRELTVLEALSQEGLSQDVAEDALQLPRVLKENHEAKRERDARRATRHARRQHRLQAKALRGGGRRAAKASRTAQLTRQVKTKAVKTRVKPRRTADVACAPAPSLPCGGRSSRAWALEELELDSSY